MMDVAKTLTQWREQSPEQWLRLANRYLPLAVMGLLVIAIAHQLANLTWIVTPVTPYDRPPPVIVQPSSDGAAANAVNYAALEDSDLFGKAPAEPNFAEVPAVAELEAPDTTLSLRLTGIAADEEGELSIAIIANGARGQERKYRISQEIENTGGTTLHAVYADRVILNRDGRLETLRLPKEVSAAAARQPARPQPTPAPMPVEPAVEPASTSLREVANENAPRLTDIMRMAPHQEGGQIVGFRVNPGRNRQAFESLGLAPGDVITEINGIVLDDPSRALQVFEALGESTQASVSLLRDGVPTVLVVDTTQVQSIVEDRQ